MSKPEVVDDIEGVRPVASDPEKTPAGGATERFGDQISHEMLEILAPNGEGDYILDKINNMSEEDALAIVQEGLEFHSDDWNFPDEMRQRMRALLQGHKLYGDFYDRDLRIDATMLRYSSPYPGVRAVADPTERIDLPVETVRAYFLGIGWAVIGTCDHVYILQLEIPFHQ
ncbi:putative oligopeptide transporter protein [Phaeoacremonium minimum UCRPA7]|uniref:Putative oligopeptide transporter protein n=1 Tax=Phaeoacremonium minimum (strain UCR-PA7) TaxID=1286976 RepID=R8BB87_PHAM7|nr:putative oligopeptide transporter protein [Phaeoacremonium minimum UCRPA7]EON96539.1 putative oligopeptide transporter protein [Phaeoacremonium minimum UCRPA7]